MTDDDNGRLDPVHIFKNHLAIVVGFADLLLSEMDEADPRRKDVLEIHKAAHAALGLVASDHAKTAVACWPVGPWACYTV